MLRGRAYYQTIIPQALSCVLQYVHTVRSSARRRVRQRWEGRASGDIRARTCRHATCWSHCQIRMHSIIFAGNRKEGADKLISFLCSARSTNSLSSSTHHRQSISLARGRPLSWSRSLDSRCAASPLHPTHQSFLSPVSPFFHPIFSS